jgi:hypothetical protein
MNHLSLFIAHLAHSSPSKISNALSALHHWHDLHSQPWHGSDPFVLKICHAAAKSLPPPSSLSSRPPVLVDHLLALHRDLDFNNTFDSSVFAIATCAFWGVCHLGEITVPSLTSFDSSIHVTRNCGLQFSPSPPQPSCLASFHLPWTKSTRSAGADISLTAVSGPTCLITALHHHLLSNSILPPYAHLFAFKTCDGFLSMTKKSFLNWCSEIFSSAGLLSIHGHSFCIGGVTEHLHCGLSVDLLKIQGCWKSDVFQCYI